MHNYRSESKALFVLETYRGIKFHFQGKYDYFKYNGKLLDIATKNNFQSSKEYPFCDRIQKGRTKGEIVNVLLSNILNNSDIWLDDISDEQGEAAFKRWQKRQDSFSYIFMKDLKTLMNETKHFNRYFTSCMGEYPDVVQYAMTELISIESVIVLDTLLNFMDLLKKTYKNDFMVDNLYLKVKSYRPFFIKYHQIDEEKLSHFKTVVLKKAQDGMNILTF